MMRTEIETFTIPIPCEQADCPKWKYGWKVHDTARKASEEHLRAYAQASDKFVINHNTPCTDVTNPPVPECVPVRGYQRRLLSINEDHTEAEWVYVVGPGHKCPDRHQQNLEAIVYHHDVWDDRPLMVEGLTEWLTQIKNRVFRSKDRVNQIEPS